MGMKTKQNGWLRFARRHSHIPPVRGHAGARHLVTALPSLSPTPIAVTLRHHHSFAEDANNSKMAEEDAVMETAEAAETEEVEVEEMGVLDALKEVLKKALVHDGLSRGLHE